MREAREPHTLVGRVSLVPDLLFDCSRVLEYAKIRTVLQSRVKMASRMTENNAYAKFWGDKQRALCYFMVFSVVVHSRTSLKTDNDNNNNNNNNNLASYFCSC